jgi:hypothetical protein
MKYLCRGYLDENTINTMSERERETFLKECSAYDNILRTNGHFVRLEGLERAQNAKTVRSRNGKVMVTDGPYAETKEQLGGLLLLEAKDLNHAAQLMSKHPGIRVGVFEIRAIDEPSCAQASEVGNP